MASLSHLSKFSDEELRRRAAFILHLAFVEVRNIVPQRQFARQVFELADRH